MGLLIDTSIFVAHERGRLDLPARLAGSLTRRANEEAFMSVISASEILHGVYRAADPAIRARRLAYVEALLARFRVLEIDLAIARSHAELWAYLAQRGMMIGVHASWIAATCIAGDLTLVTANTREFDRVPGLRVENWLNS